MPQEWRQAPGSKEKDPRTGMWGASALKGWEEKVLCREGASSAGLEVV